jgi:hypothetical protein
MNGSKSSAPTIRAKPMLLRWSPVVRVPVNAPPLPGSTMAGLDTAFRSEGKALLTKAAQVQTEFTGLPRAESGRLIERPHH